MEENGAYPKTFNGVVREIPHRIMALVWKIVSMQGVVLALGTWLVYEKKIESYAWLVVCIVVLFGRYALDFVKEIKR